MTLYLLMATNMKLKNPNAMHAKVNQLIWMAQNALWKYI